MPRKHDRSTTPPERRRAAKGTTIARFPSGRHTLESFQHFAALQAQLGVNDAETLRQALARAVHVEPLVTVVRESGSVNGDTWHLATCSLSRTDQQRENDECIPECSAVRLALQELEALP